MKLSNKQILQLRAALLALDGIDKAVEVKGQDKPVLIRKPFSFSGKTRLKIARNLRAIETAFEDYDAARIGLVREYSDDGRQVSPENLPEFTRKIEELLDEAEDIALTPLDEDELNLDDNDIPHAALAVLIGCLDEAE